MTQRDEKRDVYLVMHGHFYQPPRENPWIEAVERETGAEPHHDWNERIADECYRPNGRARVFDGSGSVTQIVNNYRHLSFNFGATLLSWMEQHAPDIYQRILQADRLSVAERGGHGNAIAQGYGHAILPLCNDRDRRTQIRWGIRDFISRFGREPEAMWLPETAVNAPTVEALIDEGMRYIILAPGQARRMRKLGGDEWHDVTGARIDPRVPYRLLSTRDPKKHIDVFFYDGPVSHAISFEGLLRSSASLVDRLWGAADQGRSTAQLIHTAVDGETYGHHHRHAERALAYGLVYEAERRGFTLTNYGHYLELHPPTHEVELHPGPDGEGTAWSCVHGVGRWCRDCGCHAAAPAGWNQAWRVQLRSAVDFVRDRAAELFEEMGGELLDDVWTARDDYVALLLDASAEVRQRFLQRHGRNVVAVNPTRVLRLLEMQRHSLLAQTSCGWFFNDISGLEAVQVLRYAARSVQLMEELSGSEIESGLLEILGEASSNIPAQGTGADVYRSQVLPAAVDSRRIVGQHAITDRYQRHPDVYTRYGFRVQRITSREYNSGPVAVRVGRLQVEFMRTSELSDLTYALLHFGSHDFHCAVRPFAGQKAFSSFIESLQQTVRGNVTEVLRAVDAHFGEGYFSLSDLLIEEREQVLEALFGYLHQSFGQFYSQLYEMHRKTFSTLFSAGVKIPQEFRMAAEYALTRQVLAEIEAQGGSLDRRNYLRAMQLVNEARDRGYRLDTSISDAHFGEQLEQLVEQIVEQPNAERCNEATRLLDLAEHLDLKLPLDRPQDLLYDMLQLTEASDWSEEERSALRSLCRKLQLAEPLVAEP